MSAFDKLVNANQFLTYDERLFGNKRFLIIEQKSCKKNLQLRRKLSNKILQKALEEASQRIMKSSLIGGANYICVSSHVSKVIEEVAGTYENKSFKDESEIYTIIENI
jgi:hypothetical protein